MPDAVKKSLFHFPRSFNCRYAGIAIFLCIIIQCIKLINSEPVNYITCGSVIKLKNAAKDNVRLHSHDIKYGTGSGQQSVTAADRKESSSYW